MKLACYLTICFTWLYLTQFTAIASGGINILDDNDSFRRVLDLQKAHVIARPTLEYLHHFISHDNDIDDLFSSRDDYNDPAYVINVGDYSLGNCKGHGATGYVFTAYNPQTKNLLAMKFSKRNKKNSMVIEANAFEKIKNFKQFPDGKYFIVEYFGRVSTKDKKNLLSKPTSLKQQISHGHATLFEWFPCDLNDYKKTFNFSDRDRVLIDIIVFKALCGLYYLHANNIIHCDIKPGNILIDDQRYMDTIYDHTLRKSNRNILEGIIVKLCDMGMNSPIGRLHPRPLHLGTPKFRAPEAFLGNLELTEKVDIWSLGVTILDLTMESSKFFGITINRHDEYILPLLSYYLLGRFLNDSDCPMISTHPRYSYFHTLYKRIFIKKITENAFEDTLLDSLDPSRMTRIKLMLGKDLYSIMIKMLNFNPAARPSSMYLINNYFYKYL